MKGSRWQYEQVIRLTKDVKTLEKKVAELNNTVLQAFWFISQAENYEALKEAINKVFNEFPQFKTEVKKAPKKAQQPEKDPIKPYDSVRIKDEPETKQKARNRRSQKTKSRRTAARSDKLNDKL